MKDFNENKEVTKQYNYNLFNSLYGWVMLQKSPAGGLEQVKNAFQFNKILKTYIMWILMKNIYLKFMFITL